MSDTTRPMTDGEVAEAYPFALIRKDLQGEWVPFSVRYGFQKISDWARKTEHYPATPGRLWEIMEATSDR